MSDEKQEVEINEEFKRFIEENDAGAARHKKIVDDSVTITVSTSGYGSNFYDRYELLKLKVTGNNNILLKWDSGEVFDEEITLSHAMAVKLNGKLTKAINHCDENLLREIERANDDTDDKPNGGFVC